MAKYEYDALVIGGGAAGLTTAGIAANFGAKTMMIEKYRLGGDCTWTGCVPSKTLLKAASVVHQTEQAGKYGLTVGKVELDPAAVMKHVDDVRREVYKDADDPEIFKEMGIDVVEGSAGFVDDHTVKITDSKGLQREVTGKYIFICTGASAFVPPIEGIDTVDYLTNESLFEIESMPGKLVIIGGGPIGSEMAQAFVRLGTDVDVVDMAPGILSNDDPELTTILKSTLAEEGVTYYLESSLKSVAKSGGGLTVTIEQDGDETVRESNSSFSDVKRRGSHSSSLAGSSKEMHQLSTAERESLVRVSK